MEVERPSWPSANQPGDSRLDPENVARESLVGISSNSIGASAAPIRCRAAHHREVSNQELQASIANLENFSHQSRKSNGSHRFFRYPDAQFPKFVLLHCPAARSAGNYSLQCHDKSDC